MLELKHFQGDYKMLCGSDIAPDKIVRIVHALIKTDYSHISEECYAWLYSLEES